MAFTAKDIIEEAGVQLQDSGAARWIPPEILSHINAAVREICVKNPRASTEVRQLQMESGVKQTLPSDCLILSRVNCNVSIDVPLGTGKRLKSIRMINSKEMLDAVLPNWMQFPAGGTQVEVLYVHYDPITPKDFYVAPANDGSGRIEVIVGVLPAKLAVPVSNPLDPASYAGLTIDLPDIYYSMVVDFVIYRAMTKDSSLPGSKDRAILHKQLFDAAIAAQAGSEYSASAAAHVANANATPR